MPSTVQTTSATIIDELDLNPLFKGTSEVSLEGPKRLGYFSCYDNNNDSVFSQDISALRYLDLPNPVNINCLQGYDPNVKYGHVVSRDMLLRWVLDNEETMEKFPSNLICNGGLLKEMMVVVYNDYNWSASAIKVRGKIVLTRIKSIEEKENIDSQTEDDNKSTYAANNLQRLISKNSNDHKCTSRKEVDSFYGVFHTKIGSHGIIYDEYLDCVESKRELDKPFEEMKFVLIKKFNGPRNSHSRRHSSTWWSLAKLAGVDTIVRAKCDQDFTVESIDKLEVDSLLGKRNQMKFLASLNSILDKIKDNVAEENKCYNIHFNGKDKKLTVEVKREPDEDIIPSWYIDGQHPDISQ
uniref:Decapping nuclease n=1 Tax=Tetranychus urticae TaxID=32264 RepID=T1KUC8_TETUR